MKLHRISNKKVTKRDQKQKSNKNGIISMQYKHNFRIRLKNTLNNKIQESWISHAWLAMHGPCMANCALVIFQWIWYLNVFIWFLFDKGTINWVHTQLVGSEKGSSKMHTAAYRGSGCQASCCTYALTIFLFMFLAALFFSYSILFYL